MIYDEEPIFRNCTKVMATCIEHDELPALTITIDNKGHNTFIWGNGCIAKVAKEKDEKYLIDMLRGYADAVEKGEVSVILMDNK